MKSSQLFCFVALLFVCACQPEKPIEEEPQPDVKAPTEIPKKTITLSDLSSFKVDGTNWEIAGNVYSDYAVEKSLEVTGGKGVLVNRNTETEKANLYTAFEHGDMELEIEFMMPKGSNSGLYFQSRYEVQLFDSYGVKDLAVRDCGSIYQRWDDAVPEGQKGYEGHPAKVNACKAPGLWQHFKIYFRAPRFDAAGNKTKNAYFEHVYLNGFLIHENVELTGPTRGGEKQEVAFAPLMIQGDHGPVAFRNMKYKAYTQDSLSLQNITYAMYAYPTPDTIPSDFTALELLEEGTAEIIDIEQLRGERKDSFAMVIKGMLDVPVEGQYLFQTQADDGANLFIDGNLVINNDASAGLKGATALTTLTKGQHQLEVTYYDNAWRNRFIMHYEGPGIYRRSLASKVTLYPWEKNSNKFDIQAGEEPELLRSFVLKDGKKRTHCISVGDPQGVHYSYDLAEAALLRFWRGDFADVTDMWLGRGEPQLLRPMNAAIEASAGLPIAKLKSQETGWPNYIPDNFKFKGYIINAQGRPVFQYSYDEAQITDFLEPSGDGKMLSRTLTMSGTGSDQCFMRIAQAKDIQQLPNGFYSVDGKYYIQIEEDSTVPILREKDGATEMLVKIIDATPITYAMMW